MAKSGSGLNNVIIEAMENLTVEDILKGIIEDVGFVEVISWLDFTDDEIDVKAYDRKTGEQLYPVISKVVL